MRILILADEFFAAREQALLLRLEVGLADEGVRVLHAIPSAARSYAPGELVSRVVVYNPPRWQFAVGPTARRLLRDATNITEEPGHGLDIIHAMGGSSWTLAAHLAREARIPVVFEVWRSGLSERARAIARDSSVQSLFISPDPSIERELRLASLPSAMIRLIPWGVHPSLDPRPPRAPDRPFSAMLVGTGRDSNAFARVLDALASIVRAYPLMVFCDADAARRASVFHRAKKLDILKHISLIAELEGRRDLLLAGDLLLQPEARGEQRSVTLDAMAHGMVVVAAADPKVSYLVDGLSAICVSPDAPDAWSSAIRKLLDTPALADALAASALQFVRQQRRAYDQVRAVLEAYASLTGTLAKVGAASA